MMTLSQIDLPGIPKVRTGKVREVFDAGEHLLMVTTDRISAFDCILPDPIPKKGEVLNRLSEFWFGKIDVIGNHLVSANPVDFPAQFHPFADTLAGRSMLVKKAQPLPVECVVRGYLAGSGWKEYRRQGTVCGIALPQGLREADPLPEAIFTPSTKAEAGHDENISWEECVSLVGETVARQLRKASLEIYERGRHHAASCGIVIADTKFEFGICDGDLILIDEAMTPDSSRFWPESSYIPGVNPPSFDKQFVRDYLESLDWPKTPPAPALPEDVIAKTSMKYIEAYQRLTGRALTET